MADIYKKVKKGILWLGEESENSSLAFRMIKRWVLLWVYKGSQELRTFFESNLHDEIFMPRSITAVNNLLQKTYWERTWIQQEIALPPMVMVQCGNERLSLIAFIGFASTVSRIDVARQRECWTGFNCHMISSRVDGIPFFRLINLRLPQLGAWKEEGDSNLWKSLYTSFGFKSTDPKDHIYALLGLTGFEKYRSLLCPSYTKSASHVFSEAARIIIEEENNLEPLAIACAFYCSNISLPSWVPDWVADEVTFISFDCTHSDLTNRKGKSASPVVYISDFVSFSADGKILSVTGISHDEVSFLKDDLLPNGLTVLEAVFRISIRCISKSPLTLIGEKTSQNLSPKYKPL